MTREAAHAVVYDGLAPSHWQGILGMIRRDECWHCGCISFDHATRWVRRLSGVDELKVLQHRNQSCCRCPVMTTTSAFTSVATISHHPTVGMFCASCEISLTSDIEGCPVRICNIQSAQVRGLSLWAISETYLYLGTESDSYSSA